MRREKYPGKFGIKTELRKVEVSVLKQLFDLNETKPLKILCLGAHSDDIEIGAGGTILKLIDMFPVESVYWVTFCSNEIRKQESLKSAGQFLDGVHEKSIFVERYRDGFLPYIGTEIKEYFEKIKGAYTPNLILTHYRNDLHQDHRKVNELTWNTFRNHLVLEYEIPKYDGDLGQPNYFFQLEQKYVDRKIEILLTSFASQAGKHWFDKETFQAIMRLRGMECAAPEKFAEAFYARKLVF